MKLIEMVAKAIREAGGDGLVNAQINCGCGLSQLMPCGCAQEICETALELVMPEDMRPIHPKTGQLIYVQDVEPGDIFYTQL